MGSVLCTYICTMFPQIAILFAVVFTDSVISTDVCGTTPISPNLNGFIVGGVEARPNSLPWQISMGVGYYGHVCGGSIVSKDTIITAAHCIFGYMAGSKFWPSKQKYYVDIGMHILKGSHGKYYKRINVKKVIVHPKWNSNKIFNVDMAILKLDTPITYSDGVQPICLPDPSQAYTSGEHFIASGWGHTKEGGSNANELQQVVVPYITSSACNLSYQKVYPGSSYVHDQVVCAGYASGGKDACQNDSGGPLAAMVNRKWTLAGVTSWGTGCARAGSPGVYTNVAKYRSFIDQHM